MDNPFLKKPMKHQVSLELPMSLEEKREEFEVHILHAQENIINFAQSHHWDSHVVEILINKVQIYFSKKEFDEAIIQSFSLQANTNIPKTVSAIIANDSLLMVTPEVYLEIYPQGMEENFYEKLITHELAHALHIRLLKGDEEKMGPRWFYEGLAIHAANQFQNKKSNLNKEEICAIITSDADSSYQNYKDVMDFVLEKVSLNELVDRAWKPDFVDFLKKAL